MKARFNLKEPKKILLFKTTPIAITVTSNVYET